MRIFRTLLIAALLAAPAWAEPAAPLDQILTRFDSVTQALYQDSGVPGMSVGVLHQGKVVYLKNFGYRQAGGTLPVDANTVFQVASCSKPITSTAIAALVGKEKLSWDDRIERYLPAFKLMDPWISSHLSFRDMLSHHSGLPFEAGDILENLGFDRETILHRLRLLPVAYEFRVGYAYSNFGFTAGGEAAAKAVHLSYETMMDQELFKPLGMTSTSARFEDYEKASNKATSHFLSKGKAIPTIRMPQAQSPAGGVSSSMNDMLTWAQLHLAKGRHDGQQFIPEAALAQTYRIHSLSSNNPADFSGSGFYGLGWGIAYDHKGRLRLSHSGAFLLGVRSSVTLLPQEELAVVVLCNGFPTALPEALPVTLLDLYDGGEGQLAQARSVSAQVQKMFLGMMEKRVVVGRQSKSAPPLPLATYEGQFSNEFFGDATVRGQGSKLTIQLGRETFPLRHLDRDTFFVEVETAKFEDLQSFLVQFVLDGQGQVNGFHQQGLADVFPWFAKK